MARSGIVTKMTTDSIGPMEIYRTMSLDDVLTERGLSTLDPTSAEMTLSAPPSEGWAKTLQPHLSNCPDGGKWILEKGRLRKWTNPTPMSASRGSISAMACLRVLANASRLKSASIAWKTCILTPRTILRRSGNCFLIVAAGPWAVAGWKLQHPTAVPACW